MEKETLKTIEDRASVLEARALGFYAQVVSLAKWLKDIRWKLADLFRTGLDPSADLTSAVSWEAVPMEKSAALPARMWWVKGTAASAWDLLSSISKWARITDADFSRLSGKQALLPDDSDAKEIPGLAAMKPVQDQDSVGTVAERLALLELDADMVQAKIATLTESIQSIHFRASGFFGIDPSLFFSFQPTAQEIAGIEAKTGLRLFPPKQKAGSFRWLPRIFGRRNS